MKLICKKSQYRRDYTGVFECEHCGHKIERSGYDDENFLVNVIPEWECPECGKTGEIDPDYKKKISIPKGIHL